MSKNGKNGAKAGRQAAPNDAKARVGARPEEMNQQDQTQETSAATEEIAEDKGVATSSEEQHRGPELEEELVQEIEQLQKELSEVNNKLLRQAAEYQNYRRRTEQEKSTMMELGQRQVIVHMLEVLDDLERSLQAADRVEEEQQKETGDAYASLREGVEFVYQKFLTQLDKLGVEPIEAIGQPFDEHVHEAVFQQPAPKGADVGIVLEEVQKGYRMGDRVLRHTKVVVAT